MLHLGIVRPDERGLITNPLGLAAVRLTNKRFCVGCAPQKRCWAEPRHRLLWNFNPAWTAWEAFSGRRRRMAHGPGPKL